MTGPDPLAGRRVVLVVNTDWFFLSHRLPLAKAAAAAGAEVLVVAADTGRADEIREAGLEFADVGMTRMGHYPVPEGLTVLRLTRLLRRTRPDVLHLVATKSLVYGGVAARLAGVRGVVSAVTGAGYALGEGRNPALQRLVRGLLRVVLRRSSVVVFQHDHDRDLYVERGLAPADRTLLVRGVGVDPDTWIARPEPAEQVVMLAARLIAEKGVETFVEAVRRLRPAHPDARFVIVGQLDPDVPTAITREQLDGWIGEGLVEWWGHRTDMHATIAACQVFVLPSFHNEGVPKVLVEAAATGRAVVASDIPGCRAVVRDGTTGLLVPPRDPAALAEAVDSLLANPWRRQRMAAAARADVASRFREADLTAQMLDAYRTAVFQT